MLLHCGLLLLFLNCVKTTKYVGNDLDKLSEFNRRFSLWPSVHNAVHNALRVRRDSSVAKPLENEYDIKVRDGPPTSSTVNTTSGPQTKEVKSTETPKEIATQAPNATKSSPTEAKATPNNVTAIASNATDTNVTTVETVKQFDLNNPGVVKRGFIVFGGFALLGIAYYIFYRRKGKSNDSRNTHNTSDANQVKYGVLQSEDRRDTELSRIPLTLESDEDEDEDLEIFDLEQKKKSLSYVNLQTNDEDVVFSLKDSDENERGNLLLDIEDGTSGTLINWSSNGNNKSIL